MLLTMSIRQRFRNPLALVVARSWAKAIDVTIVRLRLGADLRVAVDLRRACEEDASVPSAGCFEGVLGADVAGFEDLEGSEAELLGAGVAGEVVDA